jgi:hypothetical protein
LVVIFCVSGTIETVSVVQCGNVLVTGLVPFAGAGRNNLAGALILFI